MNIHELLIVDKVKVTCSETSSGKSRQSYSRQLTYELWLTATWTSSNETNYSKCSTSTKLSPCLSLATFSSPTTSDTGSVTASVFTVKRYKFTGLSLRFLSLFTGRVRLVSSGNTGKINPLKCSGIRWLHLELFSAIRVERTFLISDIQALWRSARSVRVPECQKFLKMYVRSGCHWTIFNVTIWHPCTLKG